MSRWFLVPVTVYVEVKVPRTEDIDKDRSEADGIARTFSTKRLSRCEWGNSNPWTASVRGFEVGYPEHEPDPDEEDEEEEEGG